MPCTHHQRRSRSARAGFNLVEAAIVLGIVGLVIGGIWVAASAVTRNHKANETAKGLLYLATAIQQKLEPADIIAASGGTATFDLTPYIIGSDSAPPGWVSNNTITSPMGQRMTVNVSSVSASFPRLDIKFHDISPDNCIELLSKAAPKINDPASPIMGIWMDNAWLLMPIDPLQLPTYCAATQTLMFIGRV